MNYEPIPPEMLAECRRLLRVKYGIQAGPDMMMLAAAFARGMQHARRLDKEDRDAYEAERAEWEAERAEAEQNPLVIDVDVRMSDQAIEEMRARLLAAVKVGRVQMLSDPPVYEPIRKIRQEAAQKERDEITAHINEEINATRPGYEETVAVLEDIIDWLDRRNDCANRERGIQDKDALREPEGT